MMKIVTLLLVLTPFFNVAEAADQTRSADDVARRAVDVLAGPTWEKARYFSFTFIVERQGKVFNSFPQRWDRVTGNYRVSGKDQQGNNLEIVMNINTLKGRAIQNGVRVTNPGRLSDLMLFGYRRWVNDTFWLLMPLKMLDPGAHRTMEGERNDSCGRLWDVVRLNFDHGALSPKDTYWAWVNRDTGVVEEWDMKIEAMGAEDPPVEVIFRDYRRVGGVLISTRREVKRADQVVRFDDLQILPDVPRGAFE